MNARPGDAWCEVCADIVYHTWRVFTPLVLRDY